jgi:hypothetical protein
LAKKQTWNCEKYLLDFSVSQFCTAIRHHKWMEARESVYGVRLELGEILMGIGNSRSILLYYELLEWGKLHWD